MPSYRFLTFLQTATVMTWFMLAMIAYPEVQKKCQEELDRVIGRSRMPTFKDRESLPYIRATLRELLRWRTPAPIGEQYKPVHLLYSPRGWWGRFPALYRRGSPLFRRSLQT